LGVEVQRGTDGQDPAQVGQVTVAEGPKKHGISNQTFYGWRRRYGTLAPADVKRLGQLEHENVRLKERGVSSRRACAPLSVARSTLGYESRLAAKDAPAIGRIFMY
jgi:putative transposase